MENRGEMETRVTGATGGVQKEQGEQGGTG